eukprot:633409-Pelagomonas_calceolata.AAC.2
MDVPLFWKEMTRMTDLEGGGEAVAGAECFLFPPRHPLLLNGYREWVLGTIFIGTTKMASGRLELSLCQGNDEGKHTC